jgi:hypothetical protein
LAMGKAGHFCTSDQDEAPWCGCSGIRSTRLIGVETGQMAERSNLVNRQEPGTPSKGRRRFPIRGQWHRCYPVISVSGCETMVINQTALKNSDQNVSQ